MHFTMARVDFHPGHCCVVCGFCLVGRGVGRGVLPGLELAGYVGRGVLPMLQLGMGKGVLFATLARKMGDLAKNNANVASNRACGPSTCNIGNV